VIFTWKHSATYLVITGSTNMAGLLSMVKKSARRRDDDLFEYSFIVPFAIFGPQRSSWYLVEPRPLCRCLGPIAGRIVFFWFHYGCSLLILSEQFRCKFVLPPLSSLAMAWKGLHDNKVYRIWSGLKSKSCYLWKNKDYHSVCEIIVISSKF